MKKNIYLSFLSLFSTALLAQNSPLPARFTEGRSFAAQKIAQIRSCSFSDTVAAETRSWVLNNQNALRSDVQGSPHNWVNDLVGTCAFTQTQALAPITLSLTACPIEARTKQEAAHILIKQSVGHLGVTDPDTSEDIADAIFYAQERNDCPNPPPVDPFDPNLCAGPSLTPLQARRLYGFAANQEKKIGSFKLYRRSRSCGPLNFNCSPWIIDSAPSFGIYGSPMKVSMLSGDVSIKLDTFQFRLNGLMQSSEPAHTELSYRSDSAFDGLLTSLADNAQLRLQLTERLAGQASYIQPYLLNGASNAIYYGSLRLSAKCIKAVQYNVERSHPDAAGLRTEVQDALYGAW